ncbi:hypothetical protein C1H46_029055 [Malus baccata]|uniref:PH domain-containing protein n=1 Tax=Malus baccata TaxID=106549 RepID=A0A540LFW5_MALBA|nr:hypothetical protein C1H46_029055 [Malus baccata]
MHCCITLESVGLGDQSPEISLSQTRSLPMSLVAAQVGSDVNTGGRASKSRATVFGVLHKFDDPKTVSLLTPNNDDVRLISEISTHHISRMDSETESRQSNKPPKTVGIVHLKISSFRESKSDDQKFYIFTATKTLHLRTNSKNDRAAWLQALLMMAVEEASRSPIRAAVTRERLAVRADPSPHDSHGTDETSSQFKGSGTLLGKEFNESMICQPELAGTKSREEPDPDNMDIMESRGQARNNVDKPDPDAEDATSRLDMAFFNRPAAFENCVKKKWCNHGRSMCS